MISQDGIVTIMTPGVATATATWPIQLADFINYDGLQSYREQNLYLTNISSGTETLGNPSENGYGLIQQNALEGSNVSVVEEMVNLIEHSEHLK